MRHSLVVAGQCLTVVLFVLIGLSVFGCKHQTPITPAAALGSLTITPGTLQPSFAGATTDYTVDLSNNITSVTITAQPAAAGDAVTVNSQTTTSSVMTLGPAGSTTPVSIVVSRAGTNSRTYSVLLNRASVAGNNSLQNLIVSPGPLAPAFAQSTLNYTATVASAVASVTVTAIKADPNAVMLIGSVTVPAGTASGQATSPLNGPGTATPVSIIVTAPSAVSKTYFITVIRAVPGGAGGAGGTGGAGGMGGAGANLFGTGGTGGVGGTGGTGGTGGAGSNLFGNSGTGGSGKAGGK